MIRIKRPIAPLPDGYTELAYIESTGTQYIDTGFVPNKDSSIEMKVKFNDLTINETLYCSRESTSSSSLTCFKVASALRVDYHTTKQTLSDFTLDTTKKYTFYANKNKFYINGELKHTFTSATITTPDTWALMVARNNGASYSNYGKYKLYSCRIWDNGTLIRNFVPCKNSSGTAGLYDLVNGVFYTNSGTGTFGVGEIKELPSGYQAVEYIESSGTQYINTGFIPNQDTRVTMSGMLLTHSANASLFGTRYSASSRQFTMTWEDSNNRFLSRFGNNDVQIPFTEGTVFYVDKNKNITIVNSVEYTNTDNEFTCPTALYLFATNNNGSLMHYGKLKLYSCKIYDNGILVRDFVPCYRLSDNVVGLYDLVNNTFYTNAGTGTFLIGTEVNRRDVNVHPIVGGGKLLERYIGNMLVYKNGPSYIDTDFSSCPFPTSWTEVTSKTKYTATNNYGIWDVLASGSVDAFLTPDHAFDNQTSTEWNSTSMTSTTATRYIEIDCPVLIKPKNIYLVVENCGSGAVIQGYNPSTEAWEDLYSVGSVDSKSTKNVTVTTEIFYSKFRFKTNRYDNYSKQVQVYEFQIKSGTIRQEI